MLLKISIFDVATARGQVKINSFKHYVNVVIAINLKKN